SSPISGWRARGSAEPRPYRDKPEQVVQAMLDDLDDDPDVDDLVTVDEDVPEADHSPHGGGLGRPHPRPPLQEIEQLTVGARLAEALVRDDVGGHVERGLNGDLKRVLDEPLLPYIGRDGRGPGKLAQLLNTRLDEGELLGDELAVRHEPEARAARY